MYTKQLIKYISGIMMFAMVAVSTNAQDFTPLSPLDAKRFTVAVTPTPVQGKVYEGNLPGGMVALTLEFNSESNVVITMSFSGKNEQKNATYEQNGSQIVVHAQNGDMTFNQTKNNVLSTNIKGTTLQLTCQTPDTEDKIIDVKGHVFSGVYGSNSGRLTLAFSADGLVEVSIIQNNQRQKESWPYIQNGNTITLVEPMGRTITLKLNGNNSLKGMFTIINVTLPLVQ